MVVNLSKLVPRTAICSGRLTGATAFSVLSAFNGVGMAAAGYLSDYYSRTVLLAAIFTLRGLAYILLLFVKDRVGLMCFAALFGLVDYSVVPPVVHEFVWCVCESHVFAGGFRVTTWVHYRIGDEFSTQTNVLTPLASTGRPASMGPLPVTYRGTVLRI